MMARHSNADWRHIVSQFVCVCKFLHVLFCHTHITINFYFFQDELFIFMQMSSLPECMHVYHMHAWYPQRAEEGVRFPGTGIPGGWELHSSAEN